MRPRKANGESQTCLRTLLDLFLALCDSAVILCPLQKKGSRFSANASRMLSGRKIPLLAPCQHPRCGKNVTPASTSESFQMRRTSEVQRISYAHLRLEICGFQLAALSMSSISASISRINAGKLGCLKLIIGAGIRLCLMSGGMCLW